MWPLAWLSSWIVRQWSTPGSKLVCQHAGNTHTIYWRQTSAPLTKHWRTIDELSCWHDARSGKSAGSNMVWQQSSNSSLSIACWFWSVKCLVPAFARKPFRTSSALFIECVVDCAWCKRLVFRKCWIDYLTRCCYWRMNTIWTKLLQ